MITQIAKSDVYKDDKDMTFYCVSQQNESTIPKLLQAACEQRAIEFQSLVHDQVDYTQLPQLQDGDILYRCATEKLAYVLVRQLLHPGVITFFATYERALSVYPSSYIMHQRQGLPVPKTITRLTTDRSLLRKYVESVGGFPVIVKATGGSHGVGVMKIESWAGLFSVVDFVSASSVHLILRQFIPTSTSARLIVLGDQVIDSIEYQAQPDDFRSNAGEVPLVKPQRFSADIEKVAVQAVQAMNYEFGGVDILIDTDGKPYITEVNMPCNFARAQACTGTDIAGQMVDYLLAKASK